MKRLAIAVALLGGCGAMGDAIGRHPFVADLTDVVVIGAATTVAIRSDNTAVQAAIGVDLLAVVAIPFLVVYTIVGSWGTR